jgi:hypothetical protein
MASLLSRFVASFDAIKPVPNLTGLDGEFNQLEGASGCLNGNSTAFKLLVKTSDATDPPVDQDQIGAGLLARWKQNGSSKATITNDGSLTANGLTGAAGVYTFGSVPVGPASDPVGANDLPRKSYVDGKKVSFTFPFTINDPSTATLSAREYGSLIIPAGGQYTITKCKVMFRTGSHTAGGSLTFKVDLAFVGDKSTLTLNDTNNTIATVYEDNFADFNVSESSILNCYISARSGTITERDVTITIEGYRTPF